MKTNDALVAAWNTYVAENERFVTKGVKVSGTRARKALGELAKLAKARRAEILKEREK